MLNKGPPPVSMPLNVRKKRLRCAAMFLSAVEFRAEYSRRRFGGRRRMTITAASASFLCLSEPATWGRESKSLPTLERPL